MAGGFCRLFQVAGGDLAGVGPGTGVLGWVRTPTRVPSRLLSDGP